MLRTTVAALVAALLVATPAGASNWIQLGVVDTTEAIGNTPRFSNTLDTLRPQIVRVTLSWGGVLGVARERPDHGTNPEDPAYEWDRYDAAVLAASQRGVRVVFTIFGTPWWANGGQPQNKAPQNFTRLREFAYAAAFRYSGRYARPDGVVLPRVSLWTAWNEPNLPLGLKPQWRKIGGRWVIQSARDYARICNAVYEGVHLTLLRGQKVACGVTSPRGNNAPATKRPSTSPIGFLRAAKAAGMRTFDAYAHHPYAGDPAYRPSARPRNPRAITLANIGKLIDEVTILYGEKPIWITEYGYETSPPDHIFGVSWDRQARYMREAYTIARRNPRIDMMLWFLVRDEGRATGWQSGLVSAAGRRKPSFYEFQRLAAGVRRHHLAILRRKPMFERNSFIRQIIEDSKAEISMRQWIGLAPYLGGA
ncbi:MAG TPA: glycosyl hydrolase [Gaiellaceae bacterium]|nr:glycosyl hydrolase [Gaiellaceae bacterium]